MSRLDVAVAMKMAAAPERVAAIMFDAARDPQWMAAVLAVERLPDGVRVRRSGRFLGKPISWITKTLEHGPLYVRLTITEGPFRGDVHYDIAPDGAGSLVTIRNLGEPGAFRFMPRWLIAAMMRKALRADLDRLRRLAEAAD
jgi:hypothetical protein